MNLFSLEKGGECAQNNLSVCVCVCGLVSKRGQLYANHIRILLLIRAPQRADPPHSPPGLPCRATCEVHTRTVFRRHALLWTAVQLLLFMGFGLLRHRADASAVNETTRWSFP